MNVGKFSSASPAVKGVIFAVVTLGFTKIFQFLIKIMMARIGIEVFGSYSLIIASFTSLSVLGALGLPMSTTRFVSLYKGKGSIKSTDSIISSALSTAICIGISIALCMYVFAGPLSRTLGIPDKSPLLQLLSIGLLASIVFQTIKAVFFGLLRIPVAYILDVVEIVVRCGIFYILIYTYHASLPQLMMGYSASLLLAMAIGYVVFIRLYPLYRFAIKFSRRLILYAWPVSGSEIVTSLTTMAALVILKNNSTYKELGVYAAAVSIAGLLHIIPQILLPIHFPILTSLYGSNKPISSMYKRTVGILLSTIVPVGLMLGLFSSYIIPVLFGATYLEGVSVLPILLGAYGLYAIIVWPSRQILDLVGVTKINLLLTIIRSCIVLAIAILLTPYYKSYGLGVAVLSGWAIEGILCLFYIKQNKLLYHHEL